MQTAVITGASSGIGEVTTRQLLEKGWKVYGLSRTKATIEDDNFVWLECDLANPEAIPIALEQIGEPEIELVVSNAGVAFEEAASAATKASYDKMFSVNVLAPMLLVNALKDKIQKAIIVSVSSVSDRLVEADFALYCSSKAANTRYFESLAAELQAAKVINLLPDYVDTPMLRELQAGRDFDWSGTIKVEDVGKFIIAIVDGKAEVESAANVIIVTNSLVEDLESRERLYGFNTDTNQLTRL